ncbi:ABC transporter substrate-binding protein [Aureimonas endophytica]|uniref:ABC transporter substrate-binding protein n=1 Tax=Aureimonas endophytica TaxID=2027858 RepID=A0A916ZCY5_9HYPH|nr:extracellular solute-binding protein [Aureimonas endophytica]GGD88912.1 ABC transporter substrate-binding protein [Aureimonas endophytica]
MPGPLVRKPCARLATTLALLAASAFPALAAPAHAIAMHGEPKLEAGFDHLPFVDPAAPKGGTMRYGVYGTFDNLNPIIVRGATTTARGIWFDPEFGSLVFEPLMWRSPDEPFTLYGLLAESVETDAERRFVEFTLNPKARFSDGTPVTVEDVLFTTEMMKQVGVVRPQYTDWLSRVATIEKVGERGIRFTFNEKADRELPLLLAGLPVLPEHAFDRATFAQTTLKPVIGSGPYRIESLDPGRRITYRRNPDYWAKDLPVKRGLDNYESIVIDYYRNPDAQFEAFQKGLFYVYADGSPQHWRTAYDFPAVRDGRVVKEEFETGRPAGTYGFFFNTRRPIFHDRRVRQALGLLYDFEWANKNLYFGAYSRIAGYFANSELSSVGRPADAREKALLAPFPDAVSPEVLDGRWTPPVSDASGADRRLLKEAVDQLKAAGFTFVDGRLVDPNGQPFGFEILAQNADQQRIALGYQRTLGRIGIAVSIRLVDDAQYQLRKQRFDYDVLISPFNATLSPGAEQRGRWGSGSAKVNGSFNYAGAANPAVDAMIDAMTSARTREDFVSAVRAYDRVLISEAYVVPLFYVGKQWLARWTFVHHPDRTPLVGYYLPSFWREPEN